MAPYNSINSHVDLRTKLATSKTFEEFEEVCLTFKERLMKQMEEEEDEDIRSGKKYSFSEEHPDRRMYPEWICQPHFRKPLPENGGKRDQEDAEEDADSKKIKSK